MKARKYLSLFVLIAVGLLSTSCLLPGMIPLTGSATAGPMPTMEKSADKVLATLQTNHFVRLESLAQEQYTQQDYAKPATLTFTVKITDNSKPVYFSYGWCAADEKTLQQNLQHIKVGLYFNDNELGMDVVHSFSLTSSNSRICADLGVLMSNWPAGQYKLKSIARVDQKINDGASDYEAGDYIQEYTVEVQPQP